MSTKEQVAVYDCGERAIISNICDESIEVQYNEEGMLRQLI